jgi:hypothetical protein
VQSALRLYRSAVAFPDRHPGLEPGSMPKLFRRQFSARKGDPATIWNGSRVKPGMTKL